MCAKSWRCNCKRELVSGTGCEQIIGTVQERAMTRKPRLCFLGPMIGRHKGHVTTQGQILAELFVGAGYSVVSASASLNRYKRLADIMYTLFRKRRSIELVCADVYGGPSFVVETSIALLSRVLRLPLIMVLRGGNLPNFFARFPRWSQFVLRQADVLVAPSPYLIEALRQHGFQVRLIPNVINLDNYPYTRRTSARPYLIWMRSFHEIYNPEMAIEVVAALRPSFPDVKLIMAGQDKGLQADVQRLAQRLQVDNRVEFPGFLDPNQKARLFAKADIFINTSRIDNMPVAIVEACAMGLPVVSTAVGGIPYLVTHGETALLVPPEDVQAMAEAVVCLLHDPDLVAKLSESGRRLAERSSWEQVRPQWEQLFAEVMSRRNYLDSRGLSS